MGTWTVNDLTALEIADAAADMPMFCVANRLSSAARVWWKQDGSFAAGSNEENTAYPTTRLYDGHSDLLSQANASATTWYLIIEWTALTAPQGFDAIFLLNHNFDSGVTITFERAENTAFSTNLLEIAAGAGVGSASPFKRRAFLSLGDSGNAAPNRYSVNTQNLYLRMKLVRGSGFVPQLGELILARRYQHGAHPLFPWDPNMLQSDTSDFVSKSGNRTRVVRYKGQAAVNARFRPATATYRQNFIDWFAGCGHGTEPFIWIDKPNSAPHDFWWLTLDEPRLEIPWAGPNHRDLVVKAEELGPHFLSQGY